MRHKIGFAKPAGLGSVKIEPESIELVDYFARYRQGTGTRVITGSELADYIKEMTAPYRAEQSVTMTALRRIWQWPPIHQKCHYPDRNWFNKNSTAAISRT